MIILFNNIINVCPFSFHSQVSRYFLYLNVQFQLFTVLFCNEADIIGNCVANFLYFSDLRRCVGEMSKFGVFVSCYCPQLTFLRTELLILTQQLMVKLLFLMCAEIARNSYKIQDSQRTIRRQMQTGNRINPDSQETASKGFLPYVAELPNYLSESTFLLLSGLSVIRSTLSWYRIGITFLESCDLTSCL